MPFSNARFALVIPFILVTSVSLYWGGQWMWSGFVLIAASTILGDLLLPESTGRAQRPPRWFVNGLLLSTAPLLTVMLVLLLARVGEGAGWGIELIASERCRAGTICALNDRLYDLLGYLGAIVSCGFMVAVGGQNIAHELYHRTESPFSVYVGLYLLQMSLDVPLAISHVYGHHRYSANRRDHATAKRGESSYAFIWRSTVDGNRFAWTTERKRLMASGRTVLSWRNRVLAAHLLSLLGLAAIGAAFGVGGVVAFLGAALIGKALLESVNYIQHYGLVRVDGREIADRHAWDCRKAFSASLLIQVTRHAHHHTEPARRFWELEDRPGAARMRHGYMLTILIALVPPLWRRYMAPQLDYWDARLASPEELASLRGKPAAAVAVV